MYLVPLIRANRCIAASLIYPQHPLQAIAISEIASVLLPILNPDYFSRIFGTILAIMYHPNYARFYIKSYHELNILHDQAEICCILLFVLIFGVEYIKN